MRRISAFPRRSSFCGCSTAWRPTPDTLFQDSFRTGGSVLSRSERGLLDQYRGLSSKGRETVRSVVEALCAYRDELEAGGEGPSSRVIPLYQSPAAAGYAAPVFGEDYDTIPVTDDVPQAAEFAVRIQGDSMAPHIPDGTVVYVNRDPLAAGDVGISAWMGISSVSSITRTRRGSCISSP